MDKRVPDLTQNRNASAAATPSDAAKRDEEMQAQQAELEQLAERVSAARSVY